MSSIRLSPKRLLFLFATAALVAVASAFMLFPTYSFAVSNVSIDTMAIEAIERAWKLLPVAPIEKPAPRSAAVPQPARLLIPKIKIDAELEHIGLTALGAMDVPKGQANAGWFDLGPVPGEEGSAVIDGHFGVIEHKPAIFNNLFTLKKGDKIFVVDQSGATTTFIVRELRTFGENASASTVFGSADGKSHLNLITCEGVWIKANKSFNKRLVVFTDKMTE